MNNRFSGLAYFLATMLLTIYWGVAEAQQTSPPAEIVLGEPSESASEEVRVNKALEELLKTMDDLEYVYITEGRPDPFLPFLSEEIIQSGISEESTEPEMLTGMRQFEPGQLNLRAIVFSENNPYAMVEDAAGKGYVIRRGSKIGRSGVVAEIIPNQVIIKQLSYSMTKKKQYRTVEMVLRKEGDEQ
ncbi:MAG: hypothetical protein KKB30_14545 [Proteobacteria bacterium]|nr:hypothetical protein [Pseudomonadota bacterium]MBU1715555.1 hypothetical protein [Pseudomonadota bacterium]